MALIQHFPSAAPVSEPVCSVCIANYNGVGIIGDCIDSVLGQEGGVPIEIIVHDDASTDGSVDFIRQRYPNVELLAASENAGFCIANNRMVAHARGEFVLLLNNDAALFPDALASLFAAARAQPTAAILTLPQYDWHTGQLVDRGCLLDPFYNPVPNLDPGRVDVAYVIGACLWISRALWNELGGFPEWMESIGEDIYLCCLARLRGHPVVALATSGFRHRLGESFGGARVTHGGLSTTFRRRYLSERNKASALVVCTPGAWVWALLPLHGIGLMLEGTVLSAARWDFRIFRDVYARAIRSLAREFAHLRTTRHSVQASRVAGTRSYFRAFTWIPRKMMMLFRYGVPKIAQ